MGGFVLGFVACLLVYAVLVGVLSIIQYKKKKKERIAMIDKELEELKKEEEEA